MKSDPGNAISGTGVTASGGDAASSPDGTGRLLALVARLRGEGGCPWDRKQTVESMSKYLLEEAAEAVDAAAEGSTPKLVEELGDLLLVVAMIARILEERDGVPYRALTDGICEKIVRRHPHVFGTARADTAEEVLAEWDRIKRGGERKKLFFEDPPRSLPPFELMLKVQEEAARLGFDWRETGPVAEKVREEVGEFLECAARPGAAPANPDTEAEFGDLLFSLVNVSRFLKIDPVRACRRANAKFLDRLRHMKRAADAAGQAFEELSFEQMDALWDRAKADGVGHPAGPAREG